MGCYGIGPGRVLAAIIEQNNDEHGMILPMSIAPYKVCIVPTNTKDEAIMSYANELYEKLENEKIDVVLDERNERPGVKFNDMDLIGIPVRITVGKKLVDGKVEFKLRKESEILELNMNEVFDKIKEIVQNA